MPLISVDTAMHHLRAEDDDRDDVQRKLAASEKTAMQFMQRNLYASADLLNSAKQNAISELTKIQEGDYDIRGQSEVNESLRLDMAQQQHMAINGILLNEDIEIAILLILGMSYVDREGSSGIPVGAETRLEKYRIYGI